MAEIFFAKAFLPHILMMQLRSLPGHFHVLSQKSVRKNELVKIHFFLKREKQFSGRKCGYHTFTARTVP